MPVVLTIVLVIVAIIAWANYRAAARLKQTEFIRTYTFPQGLLARFAEKRPTLTLKEQQLVLRGLRKFFLCNLMARGAFVSMPSKAVDDLWHEFILFTKHYNDFCHQAFGKFLHHTPAVALSSQKVADQGLRRTWWYACKDETINPRQPTRLPLLFALDAKLKLADGFSYLPNCKDRKANDNNSRAVNCATDFGGSGSDGGSSDGFGDLGLSSDAGGGDSSSSCGGGGCGGSGGD